MQSSSASMESPQRTQSLPIIRIITERADESIYNTQQPEQYRPPKRGDDELEKLRAQIQAEESSTRKYYSASSLQFPYQPSGDTTSQVDESSSSSSRVTAQQIVTGPPTVPDTATRIENERVLRRFPTAPVRRSPVRPLQLHVEMEDEDEAEEAEQNPQADAGAAAAATASQPKAASSTDRYLCGVKVEQCSFGEEPLYTPGIEMKDSFASLFEPINDRARKLFAKSQEGSGGGGTAAAAEESFISDAASAVTELFDNRSLHRASTWGTSFSFQDYLGYMEKAWRSSPGDDQNKPTTPSTVATSSPNVPGDSISPMPSYEWDAEEIADRMEDSLNITQVMEPVAEENEESSCYFTGATEHSSTARVPFCRAESLPSPATKESIRTKFAVEIPNPFKKTRKFLRKQLSGVGTASKDDFWSDLLEEGVIEVSDLPQVEVSDTPQQDGSMEIETLLELEDADSTDTA